MKLHTLPVVVLGATLSLNTAIPTQAGQDPQLQISASVNVVRLTVAVVHSAGRAVPPLSVEDFEVYDNGVLQKVQLLHRPTDTPLRVALVVDASPSLRPWWPTVQRTAVTFLAKLSRNGCPYVLPFSDELGPGRWGHYPPSDWREFLGRAPRGPGTALHDALIIALDQLADADEMAVRASQPLREEEAGVEAVETHSGEPSPSVAADREYPTRADLMDTMRRIVAEIVRDNPFTHFGNCDLRYVPSATSGDAADVLLPDDESIKAVLLLSDGADTASFATAEEAIDATRIANVPVFPVMLGTAGRDPDLQALLGEIARASGGHLIHDVAIADLGSAYDTVLGYLQSTYVLVYNPDEPANSPTGATPAPASSWHEVRVETRRPLLQVVVRPGYYR